MSSDPYAGIAVPTNPLRAAQGAHGTTGNQYPGSKPTDNSFLGQGARGVVSSAGDLAEKALDIGAPGAGSWLGDAASLASQGKNPFGASYQPGHNVASAEGVQLANTLMRSVAGHAGYQPAQSPEMFGQTSGQQQAQIPWLRDQPTTMGGRAARTFGAALPYAPVAALAPAATIPSVIANTAAPAAGSFAASEGVRALGGSPDDQQLASVAGGVGGGALAGALMGRSSSGSKTMANRTPRMTQEQMADALDRMRTGERIGLQPTTNEAIDASVPGASTTMTQQSVEATPIGAQVLGPRMNARPGQTANVMADILQRIAPEDRPPAMVGLDAQRASEGAIGAQEAARTALTGPGYTAADAVPTMPGEVSNLIADIRAEAAQRTGSARAELLRLAGNLVDENGNPTSNRGNVSYAARNAQERLDLPVGSADSIGRSDAGIVGPFVSRLKAIADQVAEQRRANELYGAVSEQFVNPAQAGPHGRIAATSDPAEQMNTLWQKRPLPGQIDVTPSALADMSGPNGNPGAELLRQYLGRALSGSMERGGKPNTHAPGTLYNDIAGNPDQRAVLTGSVDAVAPDANAQLADALKVMQTTAQRQGMGSNTVPKGASAQEVNSGGRMVTGALEGNPKTSLISGLTNWARELDIKMNQRELTDIVNANPDRAAVIFQQIEAARGNTVAQRAALGALRGGAVGNAAAPRQ